MTRVLVAGATGAIGREVVQRLRRDGYTVRALTRQPGRAEIADEVAVADALVRASLGGVADDVDIVVSALGASVALTLSGRASYGEVDVPANLNLLDAAKDAGVGRFVYVGAHAGPAYAHTRYMIAHERVADALRASPLSTTTVRPTGVFTALDDFLDMARRGFAPLLGDGSAKTNPIHPSDVAAAIVDHLEAGPEDVPVGGPDIITRRQIAEAAFAALDRPPRAAGMPAAIPRLMAACIRPFHPRLGDLVAFATAVSTTDAIAPQVGTLRLVDYFRDLAAERKLLPGAQTR